MSESLNDIQFKILDALYFVEPFEHILEEVGENEPVVVDELRTMIDKGWIQVMECSDEAGREFQRTLFFDTDNLQQYSFLATKDGLLIHNGM